MGFFDLFDTRESKVRGRVDQIQALASKLNADYNYGIESVKYFFSDVSEEMKECNTIVGESEGYEYCFIEYYHIGRGKNDHSKWVTKYSLRLNDEEFPDLTLETRSSALNGVGCMLLFGLPFLGVPLFVFFNFIIEFFKSGVGVTKASIGTSIVIMLLLLVVFSIFGFISFIFLGSAIDTLKKIRNQNQYYIRNPRFREKYVILTDTDASRIRRVFNEKVCTRVVNFSPEIDCINIKNGCIYGDFNYNEEQLSYPVCLKYINKLTREAKIFEPDEEDLYSSF